MVFGDLLSNPEEEWDEEEHEEEDENHHVMSSYACEDCDYRWDAMENSDNYGVDEERFDIVCPMCGSTNVTQI